MTAHRLATASILLACALSANVHAATSTASATVSLTNLTFTLIDLAPADGVAPSLQFLDPVGTPNTWDASLFVAAATPDAVIFDSHQSPVLPSGVQSILAPNQINLADDASQSAIVMTASSLLLTASMTMDATTASTGLNRYAEAYIGPTANDWGNVLRYRLGANTAVRVQGQYQLTAQTQTDESIAYASASASLTLNATSSAAESSFSQNVYTSMLGFPATQSGSIDFYLGNRGSEIEDNFIYVNAFVNANLSGVTTDVPEPTSVALMLAGLGVACAAARQRQQKVG